MTSQFTKLFYCELANIAHIQSRDTLVTLGLLPIRASDVSNSYRLFILIYNCTICFYTLSPLQKVYKSLQAVYLLNTGRLGINDLHSADIDIVDVSYICQAQTF